MNYISAYCTDAGAIKRVNQDSICIKSALSGENEYILSAVCDGLGGLSEGEKASSYVITKLAEWFEKTFPDFIKSDKSVLEIRSSLDSLLHDVSASINRYGRKTGKLLGTTMTLILCLGNCGKIIIAHIGDTRVYRIKENSTEILTSDHSVLFDEIRNGSLSEEEAADDSRQNQLTRCIGAGMENITVDYSIIPAETDCVYLICSDGFRKKITTGEISEKLQPQKITDEEYAETALKNLTETCILRNENDNISSVIIKLNEKAVPQLA